MAKAGRLTGRPLQEWAPCDAEGSVMPLVTIVTDIQRAARFVRSGANGDSAATT